MAIDVTTLLSAKGLSDREAGRAVLAAWKRREPRAKPPKAEGIAAKLGLLKKGNPTWWKNRPHALAVLAELLGCDAEQLVAPASATTSDVPFHEFPELRPLSSQEDPCFLNSSHGWLGAFAGRLLQQGQHAWLVAPPGSGKTLAIEMLRRLYADQIFTARTLVEAARQADPALPLLVEIEKADAATDAAALVELAHRRTSTCILSPFRRPPSPSARERHWQDAEWQPEVGWSGRLVRWVQGRLPEAGQLDVEGFLDWLNAIDPTGTVITTPGELLPLVAWAYRHGTPTQKIKLTIIADDWFGWTFNLAERCHPWLWHHGRRAVRGLLRRRIEDLDVPRGALPLETWASLLPDEVTPAVPNDEIRRQLDAVAKGRSVKDRQNKAAEASAALATSRPLEAVGALVEHGILRTQRDGHLDLFPTWARVALERQIFHDAIKNGESKMWGLWAAEASRKQAVDDALDAISPAELINVAAKVLREREDELATVVAVEALFSAFGRRMLIPWEPTKAQVVILQQLGRRQAQLISYAPEAGQRLPVPLTRRKDWHSVSAEIQWLAEAWRFSLTVPSAEPLPTRARWLLPGWARDLQFAELSAHLPWLNFSERSDSNQSPAPQWKLALMVVAREVMDRCLRDPPVLQGHSTLSRLDPFLPWLIIDGPARGWALTSEHYKSMHGYGTARMMGELLAQEPIESQSMIVAALWPLIAAEHQGNVLLGLVALGNSNAKLFQIITELIDVDIFERHLAATPLPHDVSSIIGRLPSRLRRSVLWVVARQTKANASSAGAHDLDQIVTGLDIDDLDLLVELALGMYALGHAAAERVWKLSPERALAEAKEGILHSDEQGRHIWFWTAPRGFEHQLLDLLELRQGSPLAWLPNWLTRVLSTAGKEAPRVFRLLRDAISDPSSPAASASG